MRSLPTLERYLAHQIYGATGFVLAGFLALFGFFDLIGELGDLGRGEYHLKDVFMVVLLTMPGHAYELFPVVVLIATLYVLAHLASNSEFTVMRASGLSPLRTGAALAKIGAVFVALTFVVGEWGAPIAEETAQKIRFAALSTMIGQELKSGLWLKDEGAFINVSQVRDTRELNNLLIYDFDGGSRLRQTTAAGRAEYAGNGVWRLHEVTRISYTPDGPRTARVENAEWRSRVTPELLDALVVKPERMSAWRLYQYTRHLATNKQKTERYDIALWKKLFYPLATLVMMALALPFGYLQARAGMVGLKVFLGIMIGVFFHMLNSLFSHIGLLQNWPPFAAAALPSAAFLVMAVATMWWVERR